MQDGWYGDKGDVVKWGALLHLADSYCAELILQVAYYRPCSWGRIEIDVERLPLPASVVSHFRDIQRIRKLDALPRIEVFSEPWTARKTYTESLLSALRETKAGRRLLLLDPDTGLEPEGRPGPEHVLESEVRLVWDALDAGEVLALFQHETNRRGEPWIEPKRRQFELALGLSAGRVKIAWSPAITKAVALYFVQKTE